MLLRKSIQMILASLILGSVAVFAQDHHSDNHAHTPPHIVFKGLDYSFDSPDTIEAGLVTLEFENIR